MEPVHQPEQNRRQEDDLEDEGEKGGKEKVGFAGENRYRECTGGEEESLKSEDPDKGSQAAHCEVCESGKEKGASEHSNEVICEKVRMRGHGSNLKDEVNEEAYGCKKIGQGGKFGNPEDPELGEKYLDNGQGGAGGHQFPDKEKDS